MRALALIAVLTASPAVAALADAEQAQASERLTARVQDVLDGILGAGRSKVRIDVTGEHSEANSDTEIVVPFSLDKASSAGKRMASYLLALPGYAKDRPFKAGKEKADSTPSPASAAQAFNREHETSRHDSGFQVRSIRATVVLDAALDDASVRDVSQLLPQLLGLDTARGDALSLLRAPLKPAWKAAFATPDDWRSAAYVAGGGLVALLAALIVCGGLVGSGRALGRALGREISSRPRPEPPAAVGADPLPEMIPGAFLEAGAVSFANESAGDAPLLGRRFDFLAGRDPELLARALSAEKPEDLAVFFGHLAVSIPDLAARLFAHLPSDIQAEASESLVKLSIADPGRLSEIEDRLRQAVENGVLGPQTLGRILSRVPGDARADLLGRLAARDARAVAEVERHVFAFEDLESLDAEPLRRLLGAVPCEIWGLALRGAPRGLADIVFAGLPVVRGEAARAAADVPQPREKVAAARSRILDALAALAAKGELSLGRADAGEDLV